LHRILSAAAEAEDGRLYKKNQYNPIISQP